MPGRLLWAGQANASQTFRSGRLAVVLTGRAAARLDCGVAACPE